MKMEAFSLQKKIIFLLHLKSMKRILVMGPKICISKDNSSLPTMNISTFEMKIFDRDKNGAHRKDLRESYGYYHGHRDDISVQRKNTFYFMIRRSFLAKTTTMEHTNRNRRENFKHTNIKTVTMFQFRNISRIETRWLAWTSNETNIKNIREFKRWQSAF